MRYALIAEAFYSNLWAILPEKLHAMRSFLELKIAGGEVSEERINEIVSSRRGSGVQLVGRVAVLPVFGAMMHRVSGMDRASGGVSCEEIGSSLESLVADRSIKSIVMLFDSPGGAVAGTPELADKVRALGQQKKIVGLADSMAASAAYWVLSQCAEVNVSPSSQVGSIGVLSAHTDTSEADKIAGVKTTYVTSAPYKVECAPESPLGEEARGEMQAKVDHYHGLFVKAVARGRSTTEHRVSSDFGGGRMLTAKAAVSAGMADRVATLEQVLDRMGASGSGGQGAAFVDQQLMAMQLGEMEKD